MQQSFIIPRTLSESARRAAQERFDRVAKPLKSLGLFESVLTRIAAIQGTPDISLKPRSVLVFCGDHGVVRQGVSQCGSDVTWRVARSICEGSSNINQMAACTDSDVMAIDMGMTVSPNWPCLIRMSVDKGTADFTQGPAMTPEQAVFAIQTGIESIKVMFEKGFRLLALGEMGIGNTTSAAALTSVLLNLPPKQVTGRGSGLSDAGLSRKIQVIQKAIRVNHPDPGDPLSVLAALGGFEIAGMAGACLGAAQYGIPVVLDGVISCTAALVAVRICPEVRHFLIASHMGREPSASALLKALGLTPIIHAELALGEGTGAVMLFPLLDMALSVYESNHTFEALDMEAYQPLGEGS